MDPADPNDSLFRESLEDGACRVIPSPLTGGPWHPAHQHGGAVTGILTRALDRIECPVPMRLARITIDMFRGVPLRPLCVEHAILRSGRRIQSVEARLLDADVVVARASGLRIRTTDELPEMFTGAARDPELGEPPSGVPRRSREFEMPESPGFIRAVDIETEMASECGVPASLWARLRCRLVEGEDTTPIERLATIVDFASGTGNAMDYTKYTSINPDLTIHVLREPRSEWIGLRGTTLRAEDGIGQSASVVYDLDGPIARVQASLLLDRR